MNPEKQRSELSDQSLNLEGQTRIFGVWILLISPENQIFMLKNLKLKHITHKVPGQIGVPAETCKSQDNRKFYETLRRGIVEEVGPIDYGESKPKMIGVVNFKSNGYDIVAPAFLIPVTNKGSIHFDPNEETPSDPENCCPEWVNLEDITYAKKLPVGPFEVPLYRFPMVEIAEMIKKYQRTHLLQIRRLKTPIPNEVFEYLEQNASTATSA